MLSSKKDSKTFCVDRRNFFVFTVSHRYLIDMSKPMDRDKVKALHQAIDAALKSVAESQGFTYQPGSLSYSAADVSGRVRFVLKGAEAVAYKVKATAAGVTIGETVRIQGQTDDYKVVDLKRVNVIVERIPDGKRYRVNPSLLVRAGLNGAAVPVQTGLSEAQIKAIIRRIAPELNRYAVDSIARDVRGGHLFSRRPEAQTEADVVAIVNGAVGIAEKRAKELRDRAPDLNDDYTAYTYLNESAQEAAWEAAGMARMARAER